MGRNSLRFTSLESMPESMRKLVQAQTNAPRASAATSAAVNPAGGEPPAGARRKYGNKITHVDGIRFDSKREATYYQQLKLRQQAGEVWFWLRQVPMHLPGGTKYVLDFLVFLKNGECQFVDVKGRETKEFRIKKREIEHQYPIKLVLA